MLLLQIVARWDDERVDALSAKLAAHPDINTLRSASAGTSLLHVVCDVNRVALIQLLLRHGADINARDAKGEVPLHTAVRGGHRAVVALLLQQSGILPSVPSAEDGFTPLHLACCKDVRVEERNRLSIVRTLLQVAKKHTLATILWHHLDVYLHCQSPLPLHMLFASLSLSLSHTHTHTHTLHSLSSLFLFLTIKLTFLHITLTFTSTYSEALLILHAVHNELLTTRFCFLDVASS